jgi:iron-sulfur cluster assembly accessory protein
MTDQVTEERRTDQINLSPVAAAKVKSLLDQEGRDDLQLRISVQPGGCSGLRYQLFFDERTLDGDVVTDFDGVSVVVDRMSVPYLSGAMIDFVSTRVARTGDDTGDLHGDLTIRGVTRPIVLKAEFGGIVPNMQGGQRGAFSASAKINREDFGLTWNVALEQGGVLVSKDIKIEIDLAVVSSVEAGREEAEAEAQLTEPEAAIA